MSQDSQQSTDDSITTESDGDSYADIRVDGTPVASVDRRKGKLEVRTYDPEHPEDADVEVTYDDAA